MTSGWKNSGYRSKMVETEGRETGLLNEMKEIYTVGKKDENSAAD